MLAALVKSNAGTFIAATEDDRTKLRVVRPGEVIVIKVGRPRNIAHHRKFMACVHFLAHVHPDYKSIPEADEFGPTKAMLEVLKKVTGHVHTWTMQSTGEIIERTRSISFMDMDEGEFNVWSDKAKPFILELLNELPERVAARHDGEIAAWADWCVR